MFSDRIAARTALFLLLLLAIGLFVYWPAITGPFVFDDFPNLQNLNLLGGVVNRTNLGEYLAAFTGSPGRPLSALSFLIEDSAWPTAPLPFKRDNLLLHLFAGILVFALTLRLARAGQDKDSKESTATWVALATTAIWLLHPLQLSATMLVVQRMNILSTVFTLLGLLAYLAILEKERWPALGRVVAAGAALGVLSVIAFLCKENGVLIFAYACALNFTLLRPKLASLPALSRRLLLWGVAAPILLLLAVAIVEFKVIASGYSVREFTPYERLLTESRILVEYIARILLPKIGGQGVFHDDYLPSHGLLHPATTLFCVLLIAAAVAVAWRFRAKRPVLAFAVLWFLAGHLLESTILPLELYFEHRNYLPMVGPLFAVASLAFGIRPPYERIARALFALWLSLAGILTAYNAHTWGNAGRLAGVWLQENPRSVRAIQFKASYQYSRGDIDGTKATLAQGLVTQPEAGELALQSLLASCLTKGLTPAEVSELQTRVASVRNARVVPDVIRAMRQAVQDNECQSTLSASQFESAVLALTRNPAYAKDSDAVGYMYYELAQFPLRDHNLDRMMQYLDTSYAARPDPSLAREQAYYLLTAGLPGDALHYLDISDNTPQPFFERWATDMKQQNLPLRQAAKKMLEIQKAQKQNAASRPAE